MKRHFDPEAIKAQIANLEADRERIDQAIKALGAVLGSMEGIHQAELQFNPGPAASEVTLQDAVKRVCMNLVDGITRQRVITWIEREYPALRALPSSVSAALINLSRGENPMLHVAAEGRGRSPAVYSTQGETVIQLRADEIAELMDETATKVVGGWQSLWTVLQRKFDKATGTITLTPDLRARLYKYYHSYGTGGWQNKVRRVFRRDLPHLFTS